MTTTGAYTSIRSLGTCATCGNVTLFVGSRFDRNGLYCTCLTTGTASLARWMDGTTGKAYTQVRWGKIAAKVTDTACSAECVSATGNKCSCQCGGENHASAHGMPF